MKLLAILFLIFIVSTDHSKYFSGDAKADAKIVNGSKHCNDPWKPVDIQNNSDSKYITVTVQITGSRGGTPLPVKTQVFERLAPKEQRELGCMGCGSTTTGIWCNGYTVVAAIYVN
jgi:hypothetical protein